MHGNFTWFEVIFGVFDTAGLVNYGVFPISVYVPVNMYAGGIETTSIEKMTKILLKSVYIRACNERID